MKRRMCLAGALVALLWATPARADNRIILRTTLSLQALNTACNPLLLAPICTVVGWLGDPLGQVYLITSPLDVSGLLNLLGNPLGIIDAELEQLLNLVGGLNILPTPIPATVMSNRTLVPYPATSTTPNAWDGYVNQPAASIVGVQDTQKAFNVLGTGIVADIDTGVDPTHPALQGVLLPGCDFTRNQPDGSCQPGGSELTDISFSPPPPCPNCSPAKVNQSTAAVLDQSTAAVLDCNGATPCQYAAFGHGTMAMGVIHLVAPTAQLLPLKAFHSDGTASLSDILRAIYYAVQNGANVINMSFDIKTSSLELQKALVYANQQGLISAASAGNDGIQEIVYPAAQQTDVMGVASTTNQDARSSFSNFGNMIVWVAAPGEAIVSTYPYNTYAAGWGTSFSAPFVSGGAALLHSVNAAISQSSGAMAVSHAVPLADAGMGYGRLDLCATLASVAAASCLPDFSVSAAPPSAIITAGQQANFTVSATPLHGSTQTVTWSCTGAPAAATCTVSPSSVTLNGSTMATATVTLTTMARVLVPPLVLPRYAPPMPTWVMLAACFAGLAVLLLFCTLSRALPKRPGLAAAAGLLALSLFSYACGGGYSGPPGSPTLSSIALNPMSVTGGSPSTGTVTLSGPAPSGGAAVSLSSANTAAATVPASVTVAYGATSATFTVSTSTVTASTPVTITASYSGGTKTASLTVTPPGSATLSAVALNPTSVTGGSPSTGTVTLSGPAPSGGAAVSLSSDNTAAATVPASVIVAAGASSATFTVSTSAVTASTPVTISASYAGGTKTASLTVLPQAPPTLSSLTLNPASVTGGAQSSTGTVTLSGPALTGGAAVSLSSSSTSTATVPASVTVAAGASSATFMVSTSAVTTSTPVTISASYAGVTKTASLTVVSQALPNLSSLTLSPTSVTGGVQSSTGTVTLSGPALTGGAQVMLSSNSGAASVPSSVTVTAGASSATFTVSTGTVTVSASVTISASYAGVTKTASLTVLPQALPTLSSLTLNPTSVTGGSPSTGTVTLSGPAPAGGATVSLSSSSTSTATVPASVTVAAGASSATFTVSTSAVTTSTPVTISASYTGTTKTASLTVAPPGTPAGTYTLTITGTSGTLSHSTTVLVTVN